MHGRGEGVFARLSNGKELRYEKYAFLLTPHIRQMVYDGLSLRQSSSAKRIIFMPRSLRELARVVEVLLISILALALPKKKEQEALAVFFLKKRERSFVECCCY